MKNFIPKYYCFVLSLVMIVSGDLKAYSEEFQFVMTGHNWNTIGEAYEENVNTDGLATIKMIAKLYYLKGIYMGINSEVMRNFNRYFFMDVGDEELVMYVDLFYIKEENLDIPVPYALKIIGRELMGDDPEAITEKLEYLRESFKNFGQNQNMEVNLE